MVHPVCYIQTYSRVSIRVRILTQPPIYSNRLDEDYLIVVYYLYSPSVSRCNLSLAGSQTQTSPTKLPGIGPRRITAARCTHSTTLALFCYPALLFYPTLLYLYPTVLLFCCDFSVRTYSPLLDSYSAPSSSPPIDLPRRLCSPHDPRDTKPNPATTPPLPIPNSSSEKDVQETTLPIPRPYQRLAILRRN